MKLWDSWCSDAVRTFLSPTGAFQRLALSPDGRSAITADGLGNVDVWDLSAGRHTYAWTIGQLGTNGVAYSPDGRHVLVGTVKGGSLRLWTAGTGELVHTLIDRGSGISSTAFSADGQWIAAASFGGNVEVWNAQTGQPVATLPAVRPWGNGLAFRPDGQTIAIAVADGSIRLWEWQSGRQRVLPGHREQAFCVVFMPDGRRLASGGYDNLVKMWGVESGTELWSMRGHDFDVMSLALSPDGQRLVSGSWDRMIVWNANTGAELLRLQGHAPGLLRIPQFCPPHGRSLVSCGQDGQLHVWEAAEPEAVYRDAEVAFQFGRAAGFLQGEGARGDADLLFEEAAAVYRAAADAEPSRANELTRGLVGLYESWGKAAEAARWRACVPRGD